MPTVVDLPKTTPIKPIPSQRLEARKRYIQGGGNLKDIAQQISVPYETVRMWSRLGKWFDLRAKYAQRQLDQLLGPELPTPELPLQPAEVTQDNPEASKLADELAEIREEMKGAGPDVKAKLANAYAKMFSAWQVLSGTPNPGSRKVRQERSPRGAGRIVSGPVEGAPVQAAQASPSVETPAPSTPPVDKPAL